MEDLTPPPISAYVDDPCSADLWWVQSIAINLGKHSITAAYASSDTNVTIIATLDTADPANNLTLYAKLMQKYRNEYNDRYKWYHNRNKMSNSWISTVLSSLHSDLARTVESLWESFSTTWPLFEETIESSTSVYLSPARILVAQVKKRSLIESIRESGVRAGLLPSDDDIALRNPWEIFTEALKSVKGAALRDAGSEINAALVVYPHYFHNGYGEVGYDGLIRQAAFKAGVSRTPCGYRGSLDFSPQSQRRIFSEHASFLLLNDMSFEKWRRGDTDRRNLLLLEQHESYLDVMASSRWCGHRRMADGLGCDAIFWGLLGRLSNKERVQVELERGASLDTLVDRVMRAKEILIAQNGQGEGQADRQHKVESDGWPVDLKDWWVSGGNEQEIVLLRWVDVEAVNDEYVEALRDRINDSVSTIQGGKEEWCWPISKTGQGQSIHEVAILGAYCDASLLTRAIKLSLGEDTKIFGSLSDTDHGRYMAEIGARAALWKYKQGTMELIEACERKIQKTGECAEKAEDEDDEDDYDIDWFTTHREL